MQAFEDRFESWMINDSSDSGFINRLVAKMMHDGSKRTEPTSQYHALFSVSQQGISLYLLPYSRLDRTNGAGWAGAAAECRSGGRPKSVNSLATARNFCHPATRLRELPPPSYFTLVITYSVFQCIVLLETSPISCQINRSCDRVSIEQVQE
jgi:hypothetical protein